MSTEGGSVDEWSLQSPKQSVLKKNPKERFDLQHVSHGDYGNFKIDTDMNHFVDSYIRYKNFLEMASCNSQET